MTLRYVYEARVLSVEEKFETLPSVQDSGGKWSSPLRSVGWFIRISEASAIGVGQEKPDIVPGDTMIITLQKKDIASASLRRDTGGVRS